jgi:hypothetical protein
MLPRTCMKLDWIKATAWFKAIVFKAIVTNYEVALNWFTKRKHQPNFYELYQKKPQTYYYQLYAESKPSSHKAFSAVLADDVFSESMAAGKGSGKQGGVCGGSHSSLKRKEEAMTRFANPMTEECVASKESQDKHTEKMQLKCDTTAYYVSICTLPESADGNLARAIMNYT